MSQPNLIATETLAQDDYQAYESIEVESVVGTARERTLPEVGPLSREADGAIYNQTALEAEVSRAWAAVHARLSRPSSPPSHTPAADTFGSAPEWAALHARLDTPVPAWAEGSRAHATAAPRPAVVAQPAPMPQATTRVRRPAVIVPERQPATRSLGGFTPEDEAFFREGESLADPRNYDFTDLDAPEPAPRRSRPVPVPRLGYNA